MVFIMHFSGEIIKELMDYLELTEYEATAYLSLIEYGALTVSEISKVSRIPRTKCYSVLKSLKSKKLVSELPSKPIKYKALPIKIAFTNRILQLKKEYERKQEGVRMLITKLRKSMKRKIKTREVKVDFLDDPNSIIFSMIQDVTAAKKEIVTAMTKSPAHYEWRDYVKEFRKILKRKVKLRFLLQVESDFLINALKEAELYDFYERGQIQIKSISAIHQPFTVIDNKIVYIYLTDLISRSFRIAIRIEDKIFGKHMKSMFESLWRLAEINQ